MTEFVTTGSWQAKPGEEEALIAAWTAFAVWSSGESGATTRRLGRDTADPSRFHSFGVWADVSSANAWKSSPEFARQLALVREHVAVFDSGMLDVVAAATAGAAVGEPTPA
jgi:heme-degrading monooxygenase HmoA